MGEKLQQLIDESHERFMAMPEIPRVEDGILHVSTTIGTTEEVVGEKSAAELLATAMELIDEGYLYSFDPDMFDADRLPFEEFLGLIVADIIREEIEKQSEVSERLESNMLTYEEWPPLS